MAVQGAESTYESTTMVIWNPRESPGGRFLLPKRRIEDPESTPSPKKPRTPHSCDEKQSPDLIVSNTIGQQEDVNATLMDWMPSDVPKTCAGDCDPKATNTAIICYGTVRNQRILMIGRHR